MVFETDVTFSGSLVVPPPGSGNGGTAGLTLSGPGTARFNLVPVPPENAFVDAINVDGANVVFNGSINASTRVLSGRLGGNTTYSNPLEIGNSSGIDDAILEPGGDGIGLITAPNFQFRSDAALRIEINSDSGTADKILSTGTVSLGSGIARLFLADLGNTPLSIGTTLTIIENTDDVFGETTGFFEGLPNNTPVAAGNNFFEIRYGQGSSGLNVTLVAIPEPSTAALAGLALCLGIARRRRARPDAAR
jgi:hypothetical protein